MKNCSELLANKLNSETECICCDLFTLKLNDGEVYHITNFDKDIVVSGNVYRHDLFIMNREQTKVNGTPSVDTLSVTIIADKSHSDNLAGEYIMKAVHDGNLDDSYLKLSRCYIDAETEETLGILELFQGKCEISDVGGMSCKLNVKSETMGLNAQFPTRIFAPQNVYEETAGEVATAENDNYTCVIPLKPSRNVLVRL